MAPLKNSGGSKKKKSTEAIGTTKTVATKRKEDPKSKSKSRTSNGTVKERKGVVVPSSSTESQTRRVDEKKGGRVANQRTAPKNSKTNSKISTKSKPKSKSEAKAQPKDRSKSKGKGKKKEEEEIEVEEGNAVCAFPMNRIKVIIRSGGDPDWRITQEAIFLINKASEKFIENACEDAFNNDKNYLGYKHISSLVSKERRYDFLSDFVPRRIKASDALAEIPVAEA